MYIGIVQLYIHQKIAMCPITCLIDEQQVFPLHFLFFFCLFPLSPEYLHYLYITVQPVSNWRRWCGTYSITASTTHILSGRQALEGYWRIWAKLLETPGGHDFSWVTLCWIILKRPPETNSWVSIQVWCWELKQSILHPPITTFSPRSIKLQKGQMKLTCHGQTHHLTVAGLLSLSLSWIIWTCCPNSHNN